MKRLFFMDINSAYLTKLLMIDKVASETDVDFALSEVDFKVEINCPYLDSPIPFLIVDNASVL